MSEREVVDWISYEDTLEEPYSAAENIGTLGGWFDDGHRWEDFIERWKPRVQPHYEALREAILERELQRGGDWHQRSETGVAVFDDGRIATFSYRAWGDLLAAVWSTELDRDLNYMAFYMDMTRPEDLGGPSEEEA